MIQAVKSSVSLLWDLLLGDLHSATAQVAADRK